MSKYSVRGGASEDDPYAAIKAFLNMSRSGFAARLKWLMGEAPLQYVTRWRMVRAVELLRSPNLTVGEVAQRVGYDSETAFSKAFKPQMGQPPNQYRKQSVV